MAILMNEFVEQAEPASCVAAGDANDGWAPLPVHEPAASDVVGVGERRLAGTRFKIVENAQLLEIGAQIAIVTLVHGDKGILRCHAAELAVGFSPAIEIVPGLNHLPAVDLAPRIENLLEPLLDFRGRYADRSCGRIDPRAVSFRCGDD